MGYKIIKFYLTKNDCYRKGRKRSKTLGILRHDTAAANPNLCRYINDTKNLGINKYGNHWNQAGVKKCVHFMIGLDKNNEVVIYQTLPLDFMCYGCGSGRRGSYNSTHVQYEILDDGYKSKEYFEKVMDAANWLDAYLCKTLNLKPDSIVCHHEAHEKGYATNHSDVVDWYRKFGYTMNDTRKQVKKLLEGEKTTVKASAKKEDEKPSVENGEFLVRIICNVLRVRKGPGTKYDIMTRIEKNEVYTIVQTKNDWGELKSGAGWISLNSKYVKIL